MGGLRLPVPYGTYFDADIEKGVRNGFVIRAVADDLGISRSFALARAHALGLSREVYANGAAARSDAVRARWMERAKRGKGKPKVFNPPDPKKADTQLSKLPHRIRAAKVPLSRHAIAALHERGLTLDELHFATGRPVEALASLIREGARPCA